jgi:enoyl-CoA hydratase/carnithine racemase
MSQDLLEHIEGGIATLTMNRPEARNAMTRPMLIDLERSLARLAADRSVRLVVLTGTGLKSTPRIAELLGVAI